MRRREFLGKIGAVLATAASWATLAKAAEFKITNAGHNDLAKLKTITYNWEKVCRAFGVPKHVLVGGDS